MRSAAARELTRSKPLGINGRIPARGGSTRPPRDGSVRDRRQRIAMLRPPIRFWIPTRPDALFSPVRSGERRSRQGRACPRARVDGRAPTPGSCSVTPSPHPEGTGDSTWLQATEHRHASARATASTRARDAGVPPLPFVPYQSGAGTDERHRPALRDALTHVRAARCPRPSELGATFTRPCPLRSPYAARATNLDLGLPFGSSSSACGSVGLPHRRSRLHGRRDASLRSTIDFDLGLRRLLCAP
jgi:hypothetical protein